MPLCSPLFKVSHCFGMKKNKLLTESPRASLQDLQLPHSCPTSSCPLPLTTPLQAPACFLSDPCKLFADSRFSNLASGCSSPELCPLFSFRSQLREACPARPPLNCVTLLTRKDATNEMNVMRRDYSQQLPWLLEEKRGMISLTEGSKEEDEKRTMGSTGETRGHRCCQNLPRAPPSHPPTTAFSFQACLPTCVLHSLCGRGLGL